MIKMKKIILGTSIAPFNIEQQVLTISSWVDSGFEVISCNVSEEIKIIKPFFENIGVEFKEIKCEIDTIRTKNLPYIHDILMSVWERCECIGGFANSDIYLDNISEDLYDFMCNETLNSLVLIRRNEIDNITDIENLNWKLHFDGIDMFLIDKKFIPDFFCDGFFVQSCWDACIPLKAKMLEIQIKELMNPIAFHKRHSQKWNFKTTNILIENFWKKYFYTKEKAYEKTMQSFYNILLKNCKQVCYLKNKNLKCLYVVNKRNTELIKNIKEQDFPICNIMIQDNDNNRKDFDYVFYIPEKIILSSIFCKYIIFIMECYKCSKLEVGKFYITIIDGEYQYSSMNKSIALLEYIQEQSPSCISIYAQKRKTDICKKIISPIVYERLDINNNIFNRLKIKGDYYIVPAGIRANQWYQENAYKLKNMKFLGFLDNNKSGTIDKHKIYSLKDTNLNHKAYVIIATKYYLDEIEAQIRNIMDENKIINAGLICYISEEGDIYCFNLEQYKKKAVKLID